jgi:hypothetical protein
LGGQKGEGKEGVRIKCIGVTPCLEVQSRIMGNRTISMVNSLQKEILEINQVNPVFCSEKDGIS